MEQKFSHTEIQKSGDSEENIAVRANLIISRLPFEPISFLNQTAVFTLYNF